VGAEDFQPTGSSNNREQHCACSTLVIWAAMIDDSDGCWYGSELAQPGDNLILHFQSLSPSDSWSRYPMCVEQSLHRTVWIFGVVSDGIATCSASVNWEVVKVRLYHELSASEQFNISRRN